MNSATNERRIRIERDIRTLRGGAYDAFDQFSDDQYRAVQALPDADRLFYLPSAADLAYMRAENIDWVARGKSDKERGEAQQKAEAGWRRARQYAEQALMLAESHRSAPEYGGVVYRSNVTLAVLALKSGDRQAAVRYMRAAGDAPASDDLRYGPFVSLRSRLVEYLLREGERESVAAFLEKSAELSITERDQLKADAAKIRGGVMPMAYQFAEARR